MKTGPLIALFLLSLAAWCRHEPGAWDRLTRIYVWASIAAGVLLLLLNAPEILSFNGKFRIQGFGQGRNPNDCGRIFSAALLLLLLAPRAALPLATRSPPQALLLRSAAASVLGLVVLLSGSRGAALGLIASLLLLFPLQRRFGALALLLLGAGVVAALVVLEVPLPRLLLATDEGNGRLEIWAQALALWQEAPLLGKGIAANFVFTASGLGSFSAVHNVYLGALVSLGLVGLLLFLALFTLALLRAARLFFRDGRAGPLALLLFGAVSMAFAAQTYYVQLTPEWFWFWIPLASVAGLEYGRKR